MGDAAAWLVTFTAVALAVGAASLWVGRRLWMALVLIAAALDERWR